MTFSFMGSSLPFISEELLLYIIPLSNRISWPSTLRPLFSTRRSFAGVPGRDDANPDDVAVAVDIR